MTGVGQSVFSFLDPEHGIFRSPPSGTASQEDLLSLICEASTGYTSDPRAEPTIEIIDEHGIEIL